MSSSTEKQVNTQDHAQALLTSLILQTYLLFQKIYDYPSNLS